MQVHPGSGKYAFLSIPPKHYNAQKLYTCTSWNWKGHASFHSVNSLQSSKIAYWYMYILGVDTPHFFLFLQYITMPKITCTSWKCKAKLKFLSIPPMNINAQKSGTCTSWKWKVNVSFHSSNLLQSPKKSHTCTSWEWKLTFLSFLQYIPMPKNFIRHIPR